VDTYIEIPPIWILPIVATLAVIGAFVAYRLRRSTPSMALVIVVSLILMYAVAWTVIPGLPPT
jgi:hypothetical protein